MDIQRRRDKRHSILLEEKKVEDVVQEQLRQRVCILVKESLEQTERVRLERRETHQNDIMKQIRHFKKKFGRQRGRQLDDNRLRAVELHAHVSRVHADEVETKRCTVKGLVERNTLLAEEVKRQLEGVKKLKWEMNGEQNKQNRTRVAEMHAASLSPSSFLKLPPLRVTR